MPESMKRNLKWLGAIGLIVMLVVAAGCAGPAGTAVCSTCHDDTTLLKAIQVQYGESLHGSGYTFERNGADCAVCHTSEGFTNGLAVGVNELDAAVENPSPVNCRTCHNIHTTYTAADWGLTVSSPVTLELTGDTLDMDKGNLCSTCHQPRWSYEIPQAGGGDYEITSTRFGPHHGPQSTMVAGLAGYGDYDGSSVHYNAVAEGCVSCHMADAYGKQAGGHTFAMGYEYHGALRPNLAGCESCHSGIESFDHNGAQTEIEALLEEVRELLVAQGLITETGSGIAGTFSSEQAGALWNYKTVEEDRSLGIHNPAYTEFLLQTAIDALS